MPGLIGYANLPPLIGMVVSSRLATLAELQSVYSVGDLYNLAEVAAVDAHNGRVIQEAQRDGNSN